MAGAPAIIGPCSGHNIRCSQAVKGGAFSTVGNAKGGASPLILVTRCVLINPITLPKSNGTVREDAMD